MITRRSLICTALAAAAALPRTAAAQAFDAAKLAARLVELGIKLDGKPPTTELVNSASALSVTDAAAKVTDADVALIARMPRLAALDLPGAEQLTHAAMVATRVEYSIAKLA